MAAAAKVLEFQAPTSNIRSIQGEQQASKDFGTGHGPATEGDVDDYVSGATDQILACRDSGHKFPARSRSQMVFTEIDSNGLYIRRVGCQSCQCADKVEKWEPVGRGRNVRWTFVAAGIEYHTGPEGEKYLLKSGAGRANRRQIRESMATMALKGQTPAQIRKMLTSKQD